MKTAVIRRPFQACAGAGGPETCCYDPGGSSRSRAEVTERFSIRGEKGVHATVSGAVYQLAVYNRIYF